jgi:NAD(P)-dependent dehydrogenase (short-subunit alcohol dehydrogenase family)
MYLENRVALISGGASGIGRATGLMLAEQGAKILIADVNPDMGKKMVEDVRSKGSEAIFLPTDTTIKAQVHALVDAGVKKFGTLDIVVNSAGINARGSIQDMKEEDWDRIVAVHLKSTFLCSQAAIPTMSKGNWGRIVNIISRAAYKGRPGTGPYAAAKGAMLALSRVMAAELGQYGVTVNNVAPGTTTTPMVQRSFATLEEQTNEARTSGVITVPLRLAEPEEIAAAALYFCGPFSGHTTGTTIHVNGGSFMP